MFDAVAARSGRRTPGLLAALGAVTLVAGLTGAPQLTSLPAAPAQAGVLLSAGTDSLAESNIALIMGPSMIPTPSQQYADIVNDLFLQPRGFAGELEVLTTPEAPYLLDDSMAEGAQALVDRVQSLIADGQAGADNPVTVFGYSQSAALTTLAMQQLYDAGVSTDAVRFVLIGDSANPNGGLLVGFEEMQDFYDAMRDSGVTLGNPTPNDLYATDIYTLEYDGYAAFPHYPLNFLATLNAIMGMATQHMAYLGLTSEQLEQAILLESSPDSLINSYMVPSEHLPLLLPLLFMPVFGKPLYDLLEPTMRILVNLGYGNIEHGWYDGPADQPTMFSLDSQDVDWPEFNAALAVAAQTGWDNFVAGLMDPATYQWLDPADDPAFANLIAAGEAMGLGGGPVPELLENLTNLMWESLVGQYLDPAYWADVS